MMPHGQESNCNGIVTERRPALDGPPDSDRRRKGPLGRDIGGSSQLNRMAGGEAITAHLFSNPGIGVIAHPFKYPDRSVRHVGGHSPALAHPRRAEPRNGVPARNPARFVSVCRAELWVTGERRRMRQCGAREQGSGAPLCIGKWGPTAKICATFPVLILPVALSWP
jgi:hypothetical protein